MVAKIELSDGPFFIYREAGKRYIAIKFSIRGRDLGSAVEDAQFLVERNVVLPANYSISWDGQFNQMKQAQNKLMVIVPLALVGIFLLLIGAFGNIRDAVIVMINIPFAAIGGVVALHLASETLSISAFFGFLSLFGIAILDGVILISFINKTVTEDHRSMKDAMVEGAALRVRPVLMTAMLSGFGLLPAALSTAIGSEAQRPFALVIVGGMVTTSILTLLVLPVIYGWFRCRKLPASPRVSV
jgi:cobalt-zinc-cadmium resistance protein CzcA